MVKLWLDVLAAKSRMSAYWNVADNARPRPRDAQSFYSKQGRIRDRPHDHVDRIRLLLHIPSHRDRGSCRLLLQHSSLIQYSEVRLPEYGHTAREDTPMLHRHECKRERRHKRPKSTAHQPRLRYGIVHSLEHRLWLRCFQREERLHAEEVCVEERSEGELVYDDF